MWDSVCCTPRPQSPTPPCYYRTAPFRSGGRTIIFKALQNEAKFKKMRKLFVVAENTVHYKLHQLTNSLHSTPSCGRSYEKWTICSNYGLPELFQRSFNEIRFAAVLKLVCFLMSSRTAEPVVQLVLSCSSSSQPCQTCCSFFHRQPALPSLRIEPE
jgi:hypothetical protein